MIAKTSLKGAESDVCLLRLAIKVKSMSMIAKTSLKVAECDV